MPGPFDFTGQNINDTYQRLVQVVGENLHDGTGSLVIPASASYAVTASYAFSASVEIIKEVSSSYAETSSYATHFIVQNDLTASNVSASVYYGDGSNLAGVQSPINYQENTSSNTLALGEGTILGLSNNVIIGDGSSINLTNGYENTIIGAGTNFTGITKGFVGIGRSAGGVNQQDAVLIGNSSTAASSAARYAGVGQGVRMGSRTVAMGWRAGNVNSTYSVFLGHQAGYNETTSNRLYIANSNTSTPLIYGEFDNNKILINGELSASSAISASTYYGDGSNLTGISSDPFPYTGSAVISGSLEVIGGLNVYGSSTANPLTITPAGKIGIATTSPRNDAALTMGSKLTFTTAWGLIEMRSIPGTGGNIMRFGPSAASQGFIKGAEGFGIGTSNGAGGPGAWEVWGKGGGGELVRTSWTPGYAAYHGTVAYGAGQPRPFHLITPNNLNQIVLHTGSYVGIGLEDPQTKLHVSGAVSASTYYGDGSNLTGIQHTSVAALNTFTSSIQTEVNTLTAATSSYLTSIPSTYFNSSLLETQNITKNFNYTSSLNVAEITSSIEGAIIDYRLTNLDSGSRVGTFYYAHDGTNLSYNDLTIPGAGIGADPILSATLTGSIVSIDIENAAGFNFSGFAKKFSKLENAVPVADPNVSYLLDAYSGAVAAYSLRQLNQFYTGSCIKIRRDSDNSELDIGFDVNGNLDTAAISTHCGANNGYVEIWYDQSGNGNHATQNTAGLQLLIYNGSTVTTENGLPCLARGAGTSYLDTSAVSITQPFSVFAVARHLNNTTSRFNALFSDSDNDVRFDTDSYGANNSFVMRAGGFLQTTGNRDFVQHLWAMLWNGASSYAYQDGTLEISGDAGTNNMSNIRIAGTSNYGTVQELIFYNSDQSSDRTNIETNINNYYNIYNTGLLAEYSGAAAAYSVRQLTTAYTGSALRIREDGTNTETDIGFDSNGDLDTASIASHCGANNGLVVTWYDQSGNENDATQSTVGNQPLIYSASAVITENGKPAVLNGGGDQELDLTSAVGSATNISAVAKTTSSGWGYLIGQSNDGALRQIGGWSSVTPNTDSFEYNGSLYIDGILRTTTTSAQQQRLIFANAQSGGSSLNLIKLGGTYSGRHWIGPIQELILWTTDQSSNRTGIETNINSYFNIY